MMNDDPLVGDDEMGHQVFRHRWNVDQHRQRQEAQEAVVAVLPRDVQERNGYRNGHDGQYGWLHEKLFGKPGGEFAK